VDVPLDSIDRRIAMGLPEPDFVKIDVEGLELNVLRGMPHLLERRRPVLYIEIHGADMQKKLENATAVVELLWQHGYAIHHVESGATVASAADIPGVRRGHLYCT
jgi:hypothetical protein